VCVYVCVCVHAFATCFNSMDKACERGWRHLARPSIRCSVGWMPPPPWPLTCAQAFEMKRDNPFNFRCIRLLSSMDQMAHLQAGPKVRVGLQRGYLHVLCVCVCLLCVCVCVSTQPQQMHHVWQVLHWMPPLPPTHAQTHTITITITYAHVHTHTRHFPCRWCLPRSQAWSTAHHATSCCSGRLTRATRCALCRGRRCVGLWVCVCVVVVCWVRGCGQGCQPFPTFLSAYSFSICAHLRRGCLCAVWVQCHVLALHLHSHTGWAPWGTCCCATQGRGRTRCPGR